MSFSEFLALVYRFKPSRDWRRHPDLAGSAKPGLSSPSLTGLRAVFRLATGGQTPPPGGGYPPPGGGVEKTKAAFGFSPLVKGFQNGAPPPPPDLIRLY